MNAQLQQLAKEYLPDPAQSDMVDEEHTNAYFERRRETMIGFVEWLREKGEIEFVRIYDL